ncbi:MAG: HAMP domain-containing histidine kinase [Candidatus Pacebacteria bacterium]|nr:HAMP domain-containing histidine kinase [Candidatus Paceibacterota bacterium]
MPKLTFFKNFFSKTPEKPTEVDKIFSFLSSSSHHPDTIENYLIQYKHLKRKYKAGDDSIFINLYLNWEEFIINNKTENYTNYSKETLRQSVTKNANIKNISLPFKLVFIEKKEQSVALYESFVLELVDYINEHLGNATLVKTVKDIKDPFLSKIKITPNGLDFSLIDQNINDNIQYPIDEITKSFRNLVNVLYSKIELSLGEKLTKNIFSKIFLDFKQTYNAELSAVILKIIPERILGVYEWLSLMSKKELERQVREKTEELTSLNNTLEKTIAQRTEELQLAYNDLKKLDEKKSEFISVAAHQLRTPLSAVKWGLNMLKNEEIGKLTADQKDFLEKNINSNNKVIELVNDLLDIDLYTKDKYNYDFHSSDLVKVISDTIESVNSLSTKRNIKIDWQKSSEKILADIDSKKISIVMQNLIDNAIKYGNENSTIKIDISKINTMVQIKVKNTGIGIPKEEAGDIFQRFFRAKNAIRKETEGMGIGLFISKNIITDHNGRIWFDSDKNGETTFYIEIPSTKKF